MFGSLNRCASPQGRRLLRLWLLRPLVNLQARARTAGWGTVPGERSPPAAPVPPRPRGPLRLGKLGLPWAVPRPRPTPRLTPHAQVLEDRLDGVEFFLRRPDAAAAAR